jgi:hypothetical protein
MNKAFSRLDRLIHLDDDPYDKFNFDPKNEQHAKLLEDFRKRQLEEVEVCFPRCVDMQAEGLTKTEDKCLRDCVQTSLRLSRLVMERASKQV